MEVKVRIDKDSMEKNFQEMLDDVTDFIFTRSQENLFKNGTLDTGQILQTAEKGYGKMTGTIAYNAPYASVIEWGANPHPVSLEGIHEIEKWCKRKLGMDERKAKQVARAIAWKIYHHGQIPHPFLRPAIDQAQARFKNVKITREGI